MMMAKATPTDHERLVIALHQEGREPHITTIDQMLAIARKHELFPADFDEKALYYAQTEWLRKVLRVREPEELPDLFNVKIQDVTPEGEIITVQGYKAGKELNREEWDTVIDEWLARANSKRKLCNKLVETRNKIGQKHGWPPLPIPFP